jgi:hypothetical protein
MPKSFPCKYCNEIFSSGEAARRHLGKSAGCRNMQSTYLQTLICHTVHHSLQEINSISADTNKIELEDMSGFQNADMETELAVGDSPPCLSEDDGQVDEHDIEDAEALPLLDHQARVEEVEDEDVCGTKIWLESFPMNKHAGAIFGTVPTKFESICDEQVLQGADIWGPFKSNEEWELAKWLMKNIGHNQADEFLKLPIVSRVETKPAFKC